MEMVLEFIKNFNIPLELKVMLSAMIPLVEARYSILFFSNSGMEFYKLFTLSVIGNLIPVPFIIFLFRPLLSFLRKTKTFHKIANYVEERTHKKAKELQTVNALGLFIFVALPIPGTGAITGAMVAALLDMRLKYALPAIILGAILATLITSGSFNVILNIIKMF